MKNYQKIALALMVGVSALGFSAFQNSANANLKLSQQTFYNIKGITSTNPADYIYRPNGSCLTSSKACSAVWNYSGTLTPGSHPNGTKVSPSDAVGTYDGN
ncbi:hypothetical protein [Pedobacter cryoconitis]|uniref:hypothetical protein n=1 Tax=Pedobacter cryoconitis TaxID=188932 RepID=UPI0016090BAD|nr:hypothetical protein [Pedobacter cryoconitis]MBB5645781.1 hypothetical protein [Pedobacter cryoconitis]